MPQSQPVSILSISQNRSVVRTIDIHIKPHGYTIGEILESNPFSASDLAIALRMLEPRPQVVLVGRGYSEDETAETRKIFADYMKDAGVANGTVIKITSKAFEKVGKEGIPSWVLEQLKDYFGA